MSSSTQKIPKMALDAESTKTVVFKDLESELHRAEDEAKGKKACLVAIGGDLNGTLFDLSEGELTMGRNEDCNIQLDFQGISRHHLTFRAVDLQVQIEDTGSRNGTYLNNERLTAAKYLKKGDIIKLGSVTLKFLPKGDPERLTYDKLHMEANCDGLTKCFNKSYFNQALENEVKKCKVTGHPLSLVIFDLDHFKKCNDTYGHDAGDYVLKEMASLIRSSGVRDGDTFARYGGEEFVVLLPKTNLKQSFEIAERLRGLIEKHDFLYDGKKLDIKASVGVADYRAGVNTGTDLFKRADSAVYVSKHNGRNQVNFFKE